VDLLDEIKECIIAMKKTETPGLTQKALNEGLDAEEILNKALIPAMATVGNQYESGEKFIPEMLIAAKAMMGALDILKPKLIASGGKSQGKVVLGTVEGDVHDIGIKLVGMMLEGAGLDVVVLGADTSKEEFLEAIKEHNANILGMSALLTNTMPQMKEVIDFLKENGLREKVKVMVGGATLNQRFADEYGADGFAPDAAQAAALAKRLLDEQSK
jgi:5-methyltetrahydrofolate--homocysteine methyltransferase